MSLLVNNRKLKQTRREQLTRTSQNKSFNWQNNDTALALYHLVHFFTFAQLQRDMTNFKVLSERKHTTVNFRFSPER